VEDTRLVAPAGGTVLSVDSAPGSLVGSGTPVVTLLDTGRLQFETNNLSERDLAQITPGQEALITLKAYPNDTVDGRVLRIAPVAEGTVGDAATFSVIIDLDGTDLDLLPGMTGRVEIVSNEEN
jgi:multidrug resistance efflux pump